MTTQDKRLTPLQPKEFFQGKWEGEGEIAPIPLLRWLYPKEKIRYFSEAEWLTDTIWLVRDRQLSGLKFTCDDWDWSDCGELDLQSNPLDCFAYCSVIPAIKEKNPGTLILHDPVPGDCECAILPNFRRGDANADGELNVTDPVFVLTHLFGGGTAPSCLKSADVNDSGQVDLTDPVYLLNFLFGGGEQPAEPLVECGFDPTIDKLTCESFEACQ